MSASVFQFPQWCPRRPEPDAVRLGYDFNRWCAELYGRERLVRRISFEAVDDARAEVERLEATGLRRLPDSKPDWTDAAYGPPAARTATTRALAALAFPDEEEGER